LYVFCIGGTQPTIKIGGVPYVTLPNNSYAYAYLPAGVISLEIDFPWGAGPRDMRMQVDLAPGQTAYLRIESSLYQGLGEQGSVAFVEPEFVVPQLRACCRLAKGADLRYARSASSGADSNSR
jgi:hypothetical protein